MDLTWIGNLLEAVLWGIVWFALLAASAFTRSRRRAVLVMPSVGFLAFGISDLFEMQSGAWWRPRWLLAIKACCVATFAYGFWRLARLTSLAADSNSQPSVELSREDQT